jgi:hypothetical protein
MKLLGIEPPLLEMTWTPAETKSSTLLVLIKISNVPVPIEQVYPK